MKLHLSGPEDTLRLGRTLAGLLATSPLPLPALLLRGDLGSGKTTLVRGFVESLPGAEEAEVSSPSFNVCNLYPTTPPVAHFDLYRLEGARPDDELYDCLSGEEGLVVVEWIQYLDRRDWPGEALLLEWLPCDHGRELRISALGGQSAALLDEARQHLSQFQAGGECSQ